MSSGAGEDDLPVLPLELYERLYRLLFGRREERERGIQAMVEAHPAHAEMLRLHWRHHQELDRQLRGATELPEAAAIPGYRLLAVLGEGGMGTVYRAEQTEPVRRMVALKVIKPGMASSPVLARFEQERQALAAMDHDAIAKVFDCGTTDRGQPWFAMELVEGEPIHRFCDERQMPLRDRLALFRQVCDGVQHAHQKGVIHRDLKPGNVLVSEQAGHHAVKIIDFGVARAIDRRIATMSTFTEQGVVLGTPEYMSPEQAAGELHRVDTRSDIYSLGVILYELLVGALPFPAEELRAAGALAMERRLRDEEPRKPSTRLTTLGGGGQTVASLRRVSLDGLRRELANDLDWVVLKAMAKEPDRRYGTATALADDLQRYLANEPLVAGPPSAMYRLRKLTRRHRAQVVGAALVFATAVVGAVVALQFAWREQAKVREFDMVAGFVHYLRADAAEQELWPPWPDRVERMERWLRDDCGRLFAMLPDIEQVVQELRTRAAVQVEPSASRPAHPRLQEWQALDREVASRTRAQAVRTGQEVFVQPALTASQQRLNAYTLHAQAWCRVRPKGVGRVYGEEPLGLAFARVALAKDDGTLPAAEGHKTLLWALHENGLEEEAELLAQDILATATPDRLDAVTDLIAEFETAQANAADVLGRAQSELRQLASTMVEGAPIEFPPREGAARFLHDSLVDLLAKAAELRRRADALTKERLRWAQQVGDLGRAHPNARVSWEIVRADLAVDPRYADARIELRDEDVVGLAPIGKNPASQLWEFYDLRSAWDGASDPRELPIPAHDEAGALVVGPDTGLVLVLVPGGQATLGSQKESDQLPHYDPNASAGEGVHDVVLSAFFISRFEMTNGQWERLWTWDERGRRPSENRVGFQGPRMKAPVTLAHPVENITWEMAARLVRRYGMDLPTDAQWEYACRAGITTPWWSGAQPESLEGCANLLDATAFSAVPQWGAALAFEDGYILHAPVGTFRPNAFGLHDVHGNVYEWCRETYGPYGSERPGDGLRMTEVAGKRVYRGGAFRSTSDFARAAYRVQGSDPYVGVRPVRELATAR